MLLCFQELEHKFDEFGKVKEARVVRNPATGESRGFGFVALDHDDEVDDVSLHKTPTTYWHSAHTGERPSHRSHSCVRHADMCLM